MYHCPSLYNSKIITLKFEFRILGKASPDTFFGLENDSD